jgi:hypothetical protein
VGEHNRAFGHQGFAEHDAVDAADEPRKRISPLLERPLTEIVGLEAEKVERDEGRLLAAGLG